MFSARANWSLVPNRLSEAVEQRRRRGLPILDLTESNPTRCGFVYDSKTILRALADPAALGYEPDPRGPLQARLAIAAYYAAEGIEVHPERIFLTTSTSEAYSYVFRLLADAGENILVPRPSYPLLDFLARLDDLELTPYGLIYDDAWRIDLDSVAAGVNERTKAILVVHPNNPTGSFVHPEELAFLVRQCEERCLALVADEVFFDYAFAPHQPAGHVLGELATRNVLSFTLSGLSKISALPQMKLAWIIAQGPHEKLNTALARLELIADTYLSVSAPLAHALPRLLDARFGLQSQIRERVRSNLAWLDGHLSPEAPLGRLKAEGGWYAVLRLSSHRTDEEWALEALCQDGVLVHPGHFYDFPSEGHVVISLLPRPETFQQGVAVLSRLFQST